MFKKLILLIIIFSPFWYSLFIGYPVISDTQHTLKKQERPGISISKRCFAVGEFKQFIECFKTSKKLSGITLFDEITKKTNHIFPFITVIIFSSLTVFVITSMIWFIK